MSSCADKVILSEELRHCGSIHMTTIRHRDFPEVCCEGSSLEEAAEQLESQLSRNLEHALTSYNRAAIEHAIEDVREFTQKARPAVTRGNRS